MTEFFIPASSFSFKEEIKKSRFITQLAHTPGIEAAQAFVRQVKLEHAAARHNCWAFVAGPPEDTMQLGFSDDGEPSGTAGKPILAQLQGSGIGEICAVVTRYSGGIKLGTGGLVSAYGGGVSHALAGLNTTLKVTKRTVRLHFDYAQQKLVEHLISLFDANILSADYSADIRLDVELESSRSAEFIEKLTAQGRGKVSVLDNNHA